MDLPALPFAKYQALGNDFVIVDARDRPTLIEDEALAVALLDRHRGIGGDDLIFLSRSAVADLRMQIRTPIGRWLSMCGNGIRCFAQYARDQELVSGDALRVETDVGVRELRWLDAEHIEVNLLAPSLRADAIPTTLAPDDRPVLDSPLDLGEMGVVHVSCVSVGNPHAIFFVDDVSAVPMDRFGPAIEHHPAFPQGVNVHAAQITSRGSARIRTWERGAGMTLA